MNSLACTNSPNVLSQPHTRPDRSAPMSTRSRTTVRLSVAAAAVDAAAAVLQIRDVRVYTATRTCTRLHKSIVDSRLRRPNAAF